MQEHNQLQVRHERPTAWSNYFYRLQQGKVVTTFYSKVSSSTICVPCTYRELSEAKAIMPPELQQLPKIDPDRHHQLALAEVSAESGFFAFNREFPVFYRLGSAYTGNKPRNRSDVPAVILLDLFSKNYNIQNE